MKSPVMKSKRFDDSRRVSMPQRKKEDLGPKIASKGGLAPLQQSACTKMVSAGRVDTNSKRSLPNLAQSKKLQYALDFMEVGPTRSAAVVSRRGRHCVASPSASTRAALTLPMFLHA
jgi:hypothetical protein